MNSVYTWNYKSYRCLYIYHIIIVYLPTIMPVKSACVCINKLFTVIPPSTCKVVNFVPESFTIASNMSLVWKQTASNAARMIWYCCVSSVIPQITLILLNYTIKNVKMRSKSSYLKKNQFFTLVENRKIKK